MLREMTAEQFNEWIAYYQIEPFGILAFDSLLAHFKAIYANAHKRKDKRPFKSAKFLCFGEKKKSADDLFVSNSEEDL